MKWEGVLAISYWLLAIAGVSSSPQGERLCSHAGRFRFITPVVQTTQVCNEIRAGFKDGRRFNADRTCAPDERRCVSETTLTNCMDVRKPELLTESICMVYVLSAFTRTVSGCHWAPVVKGRSLAAFRRPRNHLAPLAVTDDLASARSPKSSDPD